MRVTCAIVLGGGVERTGALQVRWAPFCYILPLMRGSLQRRFAALLPIRALMGAKLLIGVLYIYVKAQNYKFHQLHFKPNC